MPSPTTSSSEPRTSKSLLILILGALATISPFAIDMYLPAFSQIAESLHTTPEKIALTLSTYFVGLSLGQLFYGPLLDRFGRKNPLYAGLGLFLLCALGCAYSPTIEALLVFRFLQALGGCVASVACMAMVRDFFPQKEGAKVFSLLMLVVATSPLFAPTVGGFVASSLGWRWVFGLLSAIVFLILAACFFLLPEGHSPDESVELLPGPILRGYLEVLRERQFYTYAFAGGLAFAGLFVYVAGSPIIFMEGFGVSARTYGLIFAFLASGLFGFSQLNLLLLKRFENEQIFRGVLIVQVVIGVIFLAGTLAGWFGLGWTLALLFLILSCVGLSNPNGAALAMAPFSRNAGRASALMGFLQMGMGAFASGAVGLIGKGGAVSPITLIIAILCGTSVLALLVLLVGSRGLSRPVAPTSGESVPLAH